ncbi:MAG: Hpt domain-containing protein [Bacteroidia bacterium]|nr:Hpt domain-containing protein [Bacteroidia bacterium]MDW8332789.1 Hpt domain-containing protein [Bacteroidia bacterium]
MLNREILEQLRFLGEDDPSFVHTMVEGFLQEARENLGEMRHMPPESLERLCHKLQGAAANVGAQEFSELLRQIRVALKNEPDRVAELLERLPSVFEQTQSALQNFVGTLTQQA